MKKRKSMRQELMTLKVGLSVYYEIAKVESVRATLYRLSQITGNVYKTKSMPPMCKVTRIS